MLGTLPDLFETFEGFTTMKFMDLKLQHDQIRTEIDSAIKTVIDESAFIGGPSVDEFEAAFSETVGVDHCVSCGNGTDALYIALRALGVSSGDEVLVPAHTWIATSETVSQAGGTPVFVDIDPRHFVVDADIIARSIRPQTKGIIAVHLYGQMAQTEIIAELARQNGLWLVEDCAQAHLASRHNALAGSVGDVATFSFYPGKNLGAIGDAGAVVTKDARLAEWMRLFSNHGGKGVHKMEGINSRLDGIQAAVLNVKLRYLQGWTDRRITLAARYSEGLSNVTCLDIPKVLDRNVHVYHQYAVRSRQRSQILEHLAARSIPASINYPTSLPFLAAYKDRGHVPSHFPEAYAHSQEVFSLPLSPEMSDADQDRVVEAILEFERVR
ncbi:MAG: dTDP-4-amino-4,6-dideoxygalactose transaminase [Rhodothermales bacterium]|jgi:dTDP-4-amino-4,6-dideoxygalactose transaminase